MRTTPRLPIRAIMMIRPCEPPFPVRKAST